MSLYAEGFLKKVEDSKYIRSAFSCKFLRIAYNTRGPRNQRLAVTELTEEFHNVAQDQALSPCTARLHIVAVLILRLAVS